MGQKSIDQTTDLQKAEVEATSGTFTCKNGGFGRLVGGWTNPFEKYARQIGKIFPKLGMKTENIWNHHLVADIPNFQVAVSKCGSIRRVSTLVFKGVKVAIDHEGGSKH